MVTSKNPVSRIVDHKVDTRHYLNELRRAYLRKIYKLTLKGTDYLKIHREILKTTINYKKPTLDLRVMEKMALFIAERAKFEGDLALPLFVFLDKAYHLFKKPITDAVNTEENILKGQYLTDMINNARDNKQIFYLCSSHGDCAKDHLEYQGKIYLDEKWDLFNPDSRVFNNQYPTIQWVISGPVYMTTRPHCRHYFRPISVDEAINEKVDDLIKKYKMYHEVGPRGVNADKIAGEEKLEFYKDLYKITKLPIIAQKIAKYKNILAKM